MAALDPEFNAWRPTGNHIIRHSIVAEYLAGEHAKPPILDFTRFRIVTQYNLATAPDKDELFYLTSQKHTAWTYLSRAISHQCILQK